MRRRLPCDVETILTSPCDGYACTEGASEIQSAEHKALGHRPPSGSLAAEAQSAADKHPHGGTFDPAADPGALEAVKDAAREEGERLRETEE